MRHTKKKQKKRKTEMWMTFPILNRTERKKTGNERGVDQNDKCDSVILTPLSNEMEAETTKHAKQER